MLFEQYQHNRFVQPAGLDSIKLLKFDGLAYSLASPQFMPIQVSPVCPLGTISVITPVHQNNTLTTIRNTEVCSDVTNVLALECARRRRELLLKHPKTPERVKFCTSHRLLRTQSSDEPGAFPHFQIFVLCTAGRDEGSGKFEMTELHTHLDFYLRLLQQAEKLNLVLNDVRVKLTAFHERWVKRLPTELTPAFSDRFPDINFHFDHFPPAAENYYSAVRMQIYARNRVGTDFLLVDAGFTNWTQKLLGNRKERLLTSGIGSERLLQCFQ